MEQTLLCEGKAKQVYATNNQNEVIIYYKDDATAFNGKLNSYKIYIKIYKYLYKI